MNIKRFLLIIIGIVYISFLGILVPILISYFNVFDDIYDFFELLAFRGVFFFLFMMGTFFFFPFIYSTLVKEKLSLNINKTKKKNTNPRFYSVFLFLIGLPIMIWLIFGILGYYSSTEIMGGLGEFVVNGFLVCLVILFNFCICPAIILGFKKNRY